MNLLWFEYYRGKRDNPNLEYSVKQLKTYSFYSGKNWNLK